jgi:hypothetical protein
LLLPKHVAAAVLAGTVTRARLPEGRWTPKARDHVRIARRRRRDDDGHPTGPVRAGRPIAPLRILAHAHVRALDDIGEDDAREMGYDTVRHLVDELASTYRERIDRELAAAEQAGEDTTRYVRSIEQRLAALERRVRGGGNA